MHYPWWYVDVITAPMLIAIIATIHVYVAMYAVGGGMILAYETGRAYRNLREDTLDYLRSHLKFFIWLTVVFGAITGVGIWWTISLASPLATEALIHIFVFGWAMEWVFFIIEIIAAFIFYYYWGKLDPKTHTIIGWIYGVSAWMSLVLITGITSFMLHPGNFIQDKEFWTAFFNPQTIPQIFSRTGGSILLAGLYFFLHASITVKDPEFLRRIERRIAKWAIFGAAFTLIGGILWFIYLPESSKAALEGAASLNILMGLVFAATAVVFFFFYLGSLKGKGLLSLGYAILLFIFGLIAVGSSEFIREAVRKPYIVYDYVYGHQIYKSEVAKAEQIGFLNFGAWTRPYVLKKYPQLADQNNMIDYQKVNDLSKNDKVKLGETLFMYHCNDCHAVKGLSGIQSITRGWKKEHIETTIIDMERIHYFMPPWSGNKIEAELLISYIQSIQMPHPILDKENNSAQTKTEGGNHE